MRVAMKSLVGVMVLGLGLSAFGTEGGGGAYPNGAEGIMTGALPPPGNYLIDYNLYYAADSLMDGDGNKVPIDFDLEVFGTVFRFIHVSKMTILGGSWAQHIFIPFLNVDVSTPAGSGNEFGLGDLIVDPFILGWHKGNFHCAAGVDFYVPVGAYDRDDMANVGRNYWTVEPVFAATYLNASGYEASVKLMYDINMENSDTKVDSGDEFHCDFAIAKRLKRLTLGIGGFYYKQITNDDYPSTVPPQARSDKGQQVALGPLVSYQCGPASIVFKYQKEFETESRPEGDRFWLKLVMPL